MLQRAASNAYSWWWASHIRKKQSTWLEQNLQDMEEKVKHTLKLLEEDGDSFAKRAEMYYKKRPELIEFVEETHRAYRALADRYDHLSGELQNANHTIATVFPEQFQYAAHDDNDDDDNPSEKPACSHPNLGKLGKELPEVPNMPKFPQMSNKDPKPLPTKKPRTKKTTTTATSSSSSDSNKKNAKALEEIDKLQKEILGLQTEKEFVKSSYESGLAKYWEIEERMTQMQEQVCSLQDEFNVSTVIEDDEARALMATTALKSCKATLSQLQEKQEMMTKEATLENQKIKNAREKLANLKLEFTNTNLNIQKKPCMKDDGTMEHEVSNSKQGKFELHSVETNLATSLNMIELAEKIDELVTKVTSMEAAMSSLSALVKRLRSETDELGANLQILEDEKANMGKGSNIMNNKLKELEKELLGIQGLNTNVTDQNEHLKTDFAEANCSLDYLSKNLQCVQQPPNEDVQSVSSSWAHEESVERRGDHVQCIDPATRKDGITRKEEKGHSVSVEEVRGVPQPNGHCDLDARPEKSQQLKHQSTSETENNALIVKLQELEIDEHDQANWQSVFSNGLKDTEKILLDKYTSILRKYKKAKDDLSQVQKKSQGSLDETMVEVKKLKGANALKDKEIQSLRQELKFLHSRVSEEDDLKRSTSRSSNDCERNSKQTEVVPEIFEDERVESASKPDDSSVIAPVEAFTEKEDDSIKLTSLDEPQPLSTVEEKFRRDIDELLEENLEFWMRFSSSFQQIQKFQTQVQDLIAESSKLMVNKVQHEGKTTATDQPQRSDARPIYKHLAEIQTELTVWQEQNALLKHELQDRFLSLENIQEKLSRVSTVGCTNVETNLVRYQAAKFQGEVLNMRQENNKVAEELEAGMDHVKAIQSEIEKTLSRLKEDLKLSAAKSSQEELNLSSSRNRIPLQSFIFGTKLRKQKPKMFLAMHPALHKQKLFHAHR